MTKRIRIGKIATAHGVRGLVKVLVTAEDPALVETATVFKGETSAETIALMLKNPIGKYWVAEVAGVKDRDAALALRNTPLWIDRDALPDADEGEYYAADLIGLKAVDESGTEIGTVIAVPELMHRADTISGQSYQPVSVYTAVVVIYFAILFPVTRGMERLYQRYAHLGRS